MLKTLSKEFKFDMAHRLGLGYVGKCNNIHGHSWVVKATFSYRYLDEFSMGVDYNDIKKVVKPIADLLDHSIALQKDDTELIGLCQRKDMAHMIFEYNPTSEILAKYFIQEIRIDPLYKVMSSAGITLYSIEINETCTSACKIVV